MLNYAQNKVKFYILLLFVIKFTNLNSKSSELCSNNLDSETF
jgi:hypothetical protein